MSPVPGLSILMTSAPIHARSWVQVGPDCTWVKSRMRTPSSALPARPDGLVEGFGGPFGLLAFTAALLVVAFGFVFAISSVLQTRSNRWGRRRASSLLLFQRALRVEVADAAA